MSAPVLLVGNYPADRQESMLRFAAVLTAGLRARGRAVESISPAAFFASAAKSTASGSGKWLAYLDKYGLFPRKLRRAVRGLARDGVVHVLDHSNAMYVDAAASRGHRVLVTCHDLGAVRGALGEDTDCPASATGKILQRWITRSLARADAIACVSTATLRDVERLVPGTRASLILNGLNAPYAPLDPQVASARLAPATSLQAGDEFVLTVGSGLRRKNREGVLRIFARTRDSWPAGKLVFAGEPLSAEIHELAAQLGIGERVVEIVKPTNALLEALYNRAQALLFPSRFEGFGWPVIEAQACGCPVLCSDASSLAEVAGEGAFVRPVADEAAFANELARLAGPEGKTARADWAAAGFRNARRFTADAMLAQYEHLYAELAARGPRK